MQFLLNAYGTIIKSKYHKLNHHKLGTVSRKEWRDSKCKRRKSSWNSTVRGKVSYSIHINRNRFTYIKGLAEKWTTLGQSCVPQVSQGLKVSCATKIQTNTNTAGSLPLWAKYLFLCSTSVLEIETRFSRSVLVYFLKTPWWTWLREKNRWYLLWYSIWYWSFFHDKELSLIDFTLSFSR